MGHRQALQLPLRHACARCEPESALRVGGTPVAAHECQLRLFNRHAAKVLVDKLLPMRLPYDHALERVWLFGFKLRVVTPSPCPSDTGLATTIGDRTHLRKFKLPVYQRLPAMLFRLRNELLRAGFGLVHVLRSHRLF